MLASSGLGQERVGNFTGVFGRFGHHTGQHTSLDPCWRGYLSSTIVTIVVRDRSRSLTRRRIF